jgi:hypothetical protein
VNICGQLITYVRLPNAAQRGVSRGVSQQAMPLLFRHPVVLVDIGALCEADRDSILGAILQRDARGSACRFRCRARRADFSFDATPGKLAKTVVPISYSIELRPDVESLALASK